MPHEKVVITTKDDHLERHKGLHKCLDELLADYLIHNPKKGLGNTNLIDLIEWSFNQTINPTEYK
jgi:hypothetical protein